MVNTRKINAILEARYVPNAEKALKKYFGKTIDDTFLAEQLFTALEKQIDKRELTLRHPVFSDYTIPKEILNNNHKVRKRVLKLIKKRLKN
jgi:hypothetical protein